MKTMAIVIADFRFLGSVVLAHLIVRRTLRRRFRENSARRKQFKLLQGEGSVAQAGPQVVHGLNWRADAVAHGNAAQRRSGRQGG
jgi:hypothetical protein